MTRTCFKRVTSKKTDLIMVKCTVLGAKIFSSCRLKFPGKIAGTCLENLKQATGQI